MKNMMSKVPKSVLIGIGLQAVFIGILISGYVKQDNADQEGYRQFFMQKIDEAETEADISKITIEMETTEQVISPHIQKEIIDYAASKGWVYQPPKTGMTFTKEERVKYVEE